jgi:hypothetical protein
MKLTTPLVTVHTPVLFDAVDAVPSPDFVYVGVKLPPTEPLAGTLLIVIEPDAFAMLKLCEIGPAPLYVASGATLASMMQWLGSIAAAVIVTVPPVLTEQPTLPLPKAKLM